MKTLIKNGTVINATGSAAADVLVDGEIIAALLNPGSSPLGVDLEGSVDSVVDAMGKYVIPGGIDRHTHMELPFGGTQASTPSRPVLEPPLGVAPLRSSTSRCSATASGWRRAWPPGTPRRRGNACIDYGFHQIIGGVDEFSLKAMDGLIDEGVTSFKLFMAYPGVFYSDDAQVLKAMQKSAETGLLTMMHAENGPAIDVIAEQLYSAGKTSPYYHGIARAWQMEEEGDASRDHDRQPDRRATLRGARQRQAGGRAIGCGS